MRVGRVITLLGAVTALMTTPAWAGKCGQTPCPSRTSLKGNSVIPPLDGSDFTVRGDLFSSDFADVGLRTNGSRQVDLGFSVNFGFGAVSTLFVSENGLVSFQQPISPVSGAPISAGRSAAVIDETGFTPVTSLNEFRLPVIAPFYADLVQGAGAGNGELDFGDVVVQFGFADPYADGGRYNANEAQRSVRITWYGLEVAGTGTDTFEARNAAPSSQQVLAQLLLSGSGRDGSLSSFEFRYGPRDNPGQAGLGSIAGFSLGSNFLQFSGPYEDGIPTFFEFENGVFIGQDAAVPEPSVWLQLIFGFGLLGAALRSRRRLRAAAPGTVAA